MRVLLVRPVSTNERFGLAPFFRVEPLGLEYVGAALLDAGHDVRVADLRFAPSLSRLLASFRPALVGVACMHAVDVPSALAVAREIKRRRPEIRVVVGGHAAAVYPDPLLAPQVDALCTGDGELPMVELVDALARKRSLLEVPGFLVRTERGEGPGAFVRTPDAERGSLDAVPLPARALVSRYRRHYLCVHKMPLWAVETARGCPYRCSFCSIWRHNARSFRCRSLEHVCRDFAQTGPNLFIVDDLFFNPRSRSLELARELQRRGLKKEFILAQTRLDTVARSAEVLAAWRPLARHFDLFFGFEAPEDSMLEGLSKDMQVSAIEEGVAAARAHRFGVTGNFLVDPDWDEQDFQAMWALVDRLELDRSGYTVLTPLPGTPLYDAARERIREHDWARWDMHHVLWEPRLGRQRFFELFVESWRRNVLNPTRSPRKVLGWLRGLNPRQLLQLVRVLHNTRRMLKVDSYLKDTFPLQAPAAIGLDAVPGARPPLDAGRPAAE